MKERARSATILNYAAGKQSIRYSLHCCSRKFELKQINDNFVIATTICLFAVNKLYRKTMSEIFLFFTKTIVSNKNRASEIADIVFC